MSRSPSAPDRNTVGLFRQHRGLALVARHLVCAARVKQTDAGRRGRTLCANGHRLFLAALGLVVVALLPNLVTAQTAPDRLTVPYVPIAPAYIETPEGELTGVSADLIRIISETAGIDIVFERHPTTAAFQETIRSGTADMLPMATKVPSMDGKRVYSTPLGTTRTMLFVLAKRWPDLSDKVARRSDMRLGVVADLRTSDIDGDTWSRNQRVAYASTDAAILGLLENNVDAVILGEAMISQRTRQLGLDAMIFSVGDPLREVQRHVALGLHQAHLLPRIDAALEKLRASGELDAVLRRWRIGNPATEVPPDTLTVGVSQFGQYTRVRPDGTMTGFAVEVLRDLAAQAGLTLEFIPITTKQWEKGPGPDTYDLLPQIAVTTERQARMDFTLPIETGAFGIVLRANHTGTVTGLSDLKGAIVGVQNVGAASRLVRDSGLTVMEFDDIQGLTDALLSRQVDAIVYLRKPVEDRAAAENFTAAIKFVEPPVLSVTRAIALRQGLAAVRERLNDVIVGYLISEEYETLRRTWLDPPPFWSRPRVIITAIFGTLLVLGLLGHTASQSLARLRDKRALKTQGAALNQAEQRTRTLEDVVADLERSNRDLDDFAYIASHDLKEPLRGISINAEFLSREPLSADMRKRVDRLTTLTARMDQLICDLLYYSRLGRGRKVDTRVDPTKVVHGISDELSEWLAEIGGTIEIVTALPIINAETARVKTVLQNLIVNGLKYNRSGAPKIEIGFVEMATGVAAPHAATFFVRDNGIGIDAKKHDKIFRIFSRLVRESEFGPGSGSGLSFVRKIVEDYGGTVSLSSVPQQGSTFYVSFPLAKPATTPATTDQRPSPPIQKARMA